MLNIILLMIYVGGIRTVFKLSENEKDIITRTFAALLWPVVVSTILVENFLSVEAPRFVTEYFFKKAK